MQSLLMLTCNECYFDTDIDECATSNGGCDDNATCTNGDGNFTCFCHTGYTGDGFTCTGDKKLVHQIALL